MPPVLLKDMHKNSAATSGSTSSLGLAASVNMNAPLNLKMSAKPSLDSSPTPVGGQRDFLSAKRSMGGKGGLELFQSKNTSEAELKSSTYACNLSMI